MKKVLICTLAILISIPLATSSNATQKEIRGETISGFKEASDACSADTSSNSNFKLTLENNGDAKFVETLIARNYADFYMTNEELSNVSSDFVSAQIANFAVGIVFNIPGSKYLSLSLETLSQIFSGSIQNWNDPSIQIENPGIQLPPNEIKVIYNSGSSPATKLLTDKFHMINDKDWPNEGNVSFVNTSPSIKSKIQSNPMHWIGSLDAASVSQAMPWTIGYISSGVDSNIDKLASLGINSSRFIKLNWNTVIKSANQQADGYVLTRPIYIYMNKTLSQESIDFILNWLSTSMKSECFQNIIRQKTFPIFGKQLEKSSSQLLQLSQKYQAATPSASPTAASDEVVSVNPVLISNNKVPSPTVAKKSESVCVKGKIVVKQKSPSLPCPKGYQKKVLL